MQTPGIFIITGPVQGGKTTFLAELCKVLEVRGLKIGGFLCPGGFDAGERSGFSLKNIGTGAEVAMASVMETKYWMKYRRFWFNPDAFKQGRKWMQACLRQEPDMLIIDEVGPMELEGAGWSDLLKDLAKATNAIQLWNVRENSLKEVMQRWNISPDHLIHIDKVEMKYAAERIIGFVRNSRESKLNL